MEEREKKLGTVPAASSSTERREITLVRTHAGGTRQSRTVFHFDHVFGSFSTQEEVFAATVQPLVEQVLAGYEATVFAYGQTGTGKTHTMEGGMDSEDAQGLMPRAAKAVLDALAELGDRKGFVDSGITISYLEVYNEELCDLLAPANSTGRLDIKESDVHGVRCHGLSEVGVSSLEDILYYVARAQDKKRVAETRVHARSSRSHCIFTMMVRCRRRVTLGELENCGKLHLVDLAGSENAKKASFDAQEFGNSGRTGQLEQERRNINQSLLTLGRVIASLRDRSSRVPYRDSKLTRLLKDALGGSCKTVLIATISPALCVGDETLNTLTYAEQAMGIQNKPAATSLLKSMRFSGADSGLGGGAGVQDWAELEMRVQYLTQEVEEAQAVLARTAQENQELLERAEGAEGQLLPLHEEIAALRAALSESERLRLALIGAAGKIGTDLADTDAVFLEASEQLVSELAEVRERRSDAGLLESLRLQRVALHEDVAVVQAALDSSRQELAAVRAETAAALAAQSGERERALQAIVAFAAEQLRSLGTNLEGAGSQVREHCCRAELSAVAAAEAVKATEAHGLAAATACEARATQWCASVHGASDAMAQHCVEAIESVQRPVLEATERLLAASKGPANVALLRPEVPQPPRTLVVEKLDHQMMSLPPRGLQLEVQLCEPLRPRETPRENSDAESRADRPCSPNSTLHTPKGRGPTSPARTPGSAVRRQSSRARPAGLENEHSPPLSGPKALDARPGPRGAGSPNARRGRRASPLRGLPRTTLKHVN